jgi:hypothetical protein
VANNLRLGDRELMVRDYFYYNKPLDDQLLQLLAASNHIDVAQLDKYKGLGLREFYSAAVCGGVLLALRNENSVTEQIEAPLAFQSAMAGILELSELVISRAKLRTEKFPNVTQFYPLLQVSSRINPYNHSLPKDDTGKCICNDADYRQAYLHKWK